MKTIAAILCDHGTQSDIEQYLSFMRICKAYVKMNKLLK